MSGIAAVIHFDGAPVQEDAVSQMTGLMAHRGADGIRHWSQASVALGFCSVQTTAEGVSGAQPVVDVDAGLVLAMDGRVDNRSELLRSLPAGDVRPRWGADAELVLRAYERWGEDCLRRIDGDFSFVLWDRRRRVAFCARDRLGHKPFYYHWNGRTLSVASEPRPLLELPWVEQVADETVLAQFLADELFTRSGTLWRGIVRLPAAHRMLVTHKGPQVFRYWHPDLDRVICYRTIDEYAEHYRDLLTDCVLRCARSQAPVAYEVSGGLDSSALFSLSARLHQRGLLPAPAAKGYTLVFSSDATADELRYARAVAVHSGLDIREIPATVADLAWFRRWARRFCDFPGYPNGVMSLDLRRAARDDGCRVVVSGLGGDEWLGSWGRRLYLAEELEAGRWREAALWLFADWRAAGGPNALRWLLRDGMLPLLPEPIARALWSLKRGERGNAAWLRRFEWLRPDLRDLVQGKRHVRESSRQREGGRRLRQREQEDELTSAFAALAVELEERMAASLGMELRFPLRDYRLVELAFATPQRLRRRGAVNKWLHRRALRDVLPQDILQRHSKAEFSSVFSAQLTCLSGFFQDELARRQPDWIDADGINELYRVYRAALHGGDFRIAARSQWILWNCFGCGMVLGKRSAPAKTLEGST